MAKDKTSKETEELTLSGAMKEIESLIKEMEDPECSLEKSFELYSKGVGLLKFCSDSIDKTEKEIEILEENV